MLLATASTALLMGLAGGSHCLAMCSAPCGALTGQASADAAGDRAGAHPPRGARPVVWMARNSSRWRTAAFHAGRIAGYATAGAVAAMAMESFAWMTQHAQALRPAWTMAHVAVMAWGLLLLMQARQPLWVEQAGRAVWARVGSWARAPGGALAAGFLWALMPCGLLYSALLVAALSGGAWQGAMSMALFGIGTAVWLVGGPWVWSHMRARLNAWRPEWGTRVAGGMLCAVAGWALWMDLVYKPSLWCR